MKSEMTAETVKQDPRELFAAGHIFAVSVSGGKDSTATCLHLMELEIPHRRVFADTGWEHDDTYKYLDYLGSELGPIDRVSGERKMEELIRHKGMFPGQVNRFCTQELKFKPIEQYLKQLDDPVNVVGIRRAESRKRANQPEWEWWDKADCWVWRPLVDWTEQQVIDIHAKHGIKPNPLYLMGAERVGCWPCIYARKSEIRMVAEKTPGRIEDIRKLEADVKENATERYKAKGETFESLGYKPPTFFILNQRQHDADGNVIRDEASGKAIKKRAMAPIDDVVDWSKTVRGGSQYALFTEVPANSGCMKWGLCEH
jgi:3'-phosphoadenosine 5'-phosphosulfate sulfotransferase (PAPS reductase)/FAD synthetase